MECGCSLARKLPRPFRCRKRRLSMKRKRRHRPRPTPKWLKEKNELDEIAQRRTLMLLEVLRPGPMKTTLGRPRSAKAGKSDSRPSTSLKYRASQAHAADLLATKKNMPKSVASRIVAELDKVVTSNGR